MAARPIFIVNPKGGQFVTVRDIQFEWFPGFAVVQKQKSIESLHSNAVSSYGDMKILEISSKSKDELGIELSAFNLMITTKKHQKTFSVESAFQGSKVFENGGPFIDLLSKTSREAKKDPRLRSSGKLTKFSFYDTEWELEPKTLFYDWLYIKALLNKPELINQILAFDAFTDIEFNPEKSINCQAYSAALFVSLVKRNILDEAFQSVEGYRNLIRPSNNSDNSQLSFAD